jgi:hypothetical protein
MPVTITLVRGVGGSPPPGIHVEGTKTGCEQVMVTTSCSDHQPVLDPDTWSVVIPNDRPCPCGSAVTVTAIGDRGLASKP